MMHSRSSHRTLLGACGALLLLGTSACGGDATEQGAGPSSSPVAESTSTSPTTGRIPPESPEAVTGEVHPPQTPAPAEPATPNSGEPAPASGEPAPAPAPTPAPGAGDFVGLLERQGAIPPAGKDPVQLAQEACSRFDQGQTMMDISRWLGEEAGFDRDKQGFFLGAAVPTYCPANIAKMG